MQCKWCNSENATESLEPAYWELPDGTNAVEILQVPSVKCQDCNIIYIEEKLIDELENHFMLIDTKKLTNTFTYEELMKQPTLLKKNYFAFTVE